MTAGRHCYMRSRTEMSILYGYCSHITLALLVGTTLEKREGQ